MRETDMAIFEAPLAHEAPHLSAAPEASFEWETHSASHFSPENPEAWENQEAWESSPEAWENPEAWESSPEAWENPEAWESSPEAWENPEADRFLPLIPLAMKALPSLARMAMPAIRKLLPFGRRIAGRVARQALGGGGRRPRPSLPGGGGPQPAATTPSPPAGWAPRPGPRRMPYGAPVRRPWTRRRRVTVASLLRQLANVLGEGEAEAAQAEASFF